jgi:hypothetical protein
MREYPTATVRTTDGKDWTSAAIVELRLAGQSTYVDVVLPTSRAALARLHRRATVLIASPGKRSTIEGTVTAVSRHEAGLRCRIRVEPDAARAEGHQRQAFRVRPALTAPVRARITRPELGVEVRARDVSVAGICLAVPAAVEEDLADCWRVGVDLLLPGEEQAFALEIDVQRRFADGPGAGLAGRFVWPSPHGTSDAERALFQYVMHRQREDVPGPAER